MTVQEAGCIVIGVIWGGILTMLASKRALVGTRLYAVMAMMTASAVVWAVLT